MKKNVTLAVLAALMLSGCPTPYQEGATMGVRVNDANAPNARIQYDQVVILDKHLQDSRAGKIAVEGQGARRTATGALNVVVQLRNRTDFPQVVEARTTYFDSAFIPVEKASAWQRVHLDPNGIGAYQESSMGGANVAHYYVELREAR
jgi:hypothetical protein